MAPPNEDLDVIPPWLQRTQNQRYFSQVLALLESRERQRNGHRMVCRRDVRAALNKRPVSPSNTPRLYSIAFGCLPQNKRGNRYIDCQPYDHSRVVFENERRYLNASWVREKFGGPKWWIAAQAPTPASTHAFLSVIRRQVAHDTWSPRGLRQTSRIRTVIQLTRNVENGKPKADHYFPLKVGQYTIFLPEPGFSDTEKPYKVTLEGATTIDRANCVLSTVLIEVYDPSGEADPDPVRFEHYLYTAWPDHGVPAVTERDSLLSFIRLVHTANLITGGNTLDPHAPMVVHCSAGIGRTGTFIAISSLLRNINYLKPADKRAPNPDLPTSPLGAIEECFDGWMGEVLRMDMVAQEIDSLREQRPGAVQRDEQVQLVYTMLAEAFVEDETRERERKRRGGGRSNSTSRDRY